MTSMGKIFGIGLSKTGTTSLDHALTALGFRSVHFAADAQTFRQIEAADYQLKLLERVDALTDIPLVPYFRQLDRLYPDSKFILTLREASSWLASMERHYQAHPVHTATRPEVIRYFRLANYGSLTFNREHLLDVYDDHVRRVTHYFRDRPQDLLVMNICEGDGWEALCPFLGKAAPPIPFPWANRTE